MKKSFKILFRYNDEIKKKCTKIVLNFYYMIKN